MSRLLPLLLLLGLAACAGADDAVDDASKKPRPGRLELVSGTRPAPGLDGLIDFGTVTVGEPRSKAVVVRNTGDLAVRVELAQPAAPFSTDHAGSVEVAPGHDYPINFSVVVPDEARLETSSRIRWSDGAIDLRLRAVGAGCSLALSETVLDFGQLHAGERSARSLSLENEGAGLCVLEGLEVEGAAFSAVERPRTAILPGAALSLQVLFESAGSGVAEGRLHLIVSGAAHEVALVASVAERCVFADPPEVRIEVPLGCGLTHAADLVVRNDCTHPLDLAEMGFSPDDGDFSWSWEPPGDPFANGASHRFSIQTHGEVSAPRSALFRLVFAEGDQLEVPILVVPTGAPQTGELPAISQSWLIERPAPLDVLVVVDDTELMLAHAGAADAFAATLVGALDGHDFHLGVTTTSRTTATGCDLAPDGRLLPFDGSGPRILTPDTPGLVDTLAARLDAGTCQSPATAAGLSAAWRALGELAGIADDPAHPEADDGNLGFLRDGSHVLLLLLVAGDDQASGPVEARVTQFEDFTASPDRMGLQVQTWIELPGAICDGVAADRYVAFTDAMGGALHNLCAAPWQPPVSLAVDPVSASFPLTHLPRDRNDDGLLNEEDVTVMLDDVEVPPYTESGEPVWTLYSESKRVSFYVGHRPRGGQALTITYLLPCEGT